MKTFTLGSKFCQVRPKGKSNRCQKCKSSILWSPSQFSNKTLQTAALFLSDWKSPCAGFRPPPPSPSPLTSASLDALAKEKKRLDSNNSSLFQKTWLLRMSLTIWRFRPITRLLTLLLVHVHLLRCVNENQHYQTSSSSSSSSP